MKYLQIVVVLFLMSGIFSVAEAQSPRLTRILFIFDESNSMNGEWENDTKINVARRLLGEMLDSLEKLDNLELALRMYGHQSPVPPQDCSDTRLEVPFSKNNIDQIREKLRTTVPKGTTPIAYSLELAGNDFPPCSRCNNVIILITDGIEACKGDPCAIALSLHRRGISLKPYVIGIGLDAELKKAFECLGDHYFDAEDELSFRNILQEVVTEVAYSSEITSAQVNLLDIKNYPNETNVNMTVINSQTNEVLYNYIHAIDSQGRTDTFYWDPKITYKIQVSTLPPVSKDDIRLQPGHNLISIPSPQGTLLVREAAGEKHNEIRVIVRQSGSCKTLNIQNFHEQHKYLVGRYDLEVHTIPKMYFRDVEIKQSQTTTIRVPQPGVVTISMPTPGYGSLYAERKDGLQWLCHLHNSIKETLNLLPGKYRAVYRPAKIKHAKLTKTRRFEIRAGYSESVSF